MFCFRFKNTRLKELSNNFFSLTLTNFPFPVCADSKGKFKTTCSFSATSVILCIHSPRFPFHLYRRWPLQTSSANGARILRMLFPEQFLQIKAIDIWNPEKLVQVCHRDVS